MKRRKTDNPALIAKTIKDLAKSHGLHEYHWNHQDRLRLFIIELSKLVDKMELPQK